MKNIFVGIDLGTTNTTCSALISNEKEHMNMVDVPILQLTGPPESDTPFSTNMILPSVTWLFDSGKVFTGSYCKDIGANFLDYPNSKIVRSIKRQMANRSWMLRTPQMEYHPVHISALILKTVYRSLLEKFEEADIKTVAVTIPASFSSRMRRATLQAAEMAGINPEKTILIDEPVAALFSNWKPALERFTNIDASGNYLVFDMGGGTLDVSILHLNLENRRITVKATSRYNEVAGDDLDLEIAALILQKTKNSTLYNQFLKIEDTSVGSERFKGIGLGLIELAEGLKIDLAETLESDPPGSFEWVLSKYTAQNKELPISLTDEFDNASPETISIPVRDLLNTISPFIAFETKDNDRNIFVPIKQACERAEIDPRKIDDFMIVGGAAFFPPIISALISSFHKEPIRLDPRRAVSRGAAIVSFFNRTKSWEIKETLRDALFLKRKGHPFLQVFPPAEVPSEKPVRKFFDDEDCPYVSKGSRYICLEFFQGMSANDPLMSFAHIEYLELERVLGENSRLVEIVGQVDSNKMYHFDLVFTDDQGSLNAKISFETACAIVEKPYQSLAGILLNGVSL